MRKSLWVLVLFILAGILFRFSSFSPTVIDHDESTYIIIADQMLNGAELYKDVVDIKPPGIFYIYILILKLFENGILGVRIIASVIVSITAFLIYRLSLYFWKERFIGVLSGLLYIVMTSIAGFSLAANTELFFLFFIVLGLNIILEYPESNISYLLFGISLGCAVIIKQIILIESFFFGLCALVYQIKKGKHPGIILIRAVLYITGIVIPIIIIFLNFRLHGAIDELIEYTYIIPGRYPSPIDPGELVEFIVKLHIRYFFALIPFYYLIAFNLVKKNSNLKVFIVSSLLWFVVILGTIILPGKFFQHYYIQLFPVISIVTPGVLLIPKKLFKFVLKKEAIILTVLILFLFAGTFLVQRYYFAGMDIPLNVAEDLSSELSDNDSIFVGKQYHILYYLLHKKPLTRYIHPTLLSNSEHVQAIGYDNDKELEKILEYKPRFIITKGSYPVDWVEGYISKNYKLYQWYDDTVRVMEIISEER